MSKTDALTNKESKQRGCKIAAVRKTSNLSLLFQATVLDYTLNISRDQNMVPAVIFLQYLLYNI